LVDLEVICRKERLRAGLTGPRVLDPLVTEEAAPEPLGVVVDPHLKVRVERGT
jgi:hypothetical protein